MNQYKIEMKEIFRKEILVCAESEKEATDIVEKAYLRTNMLDHSYKDLAAVETKVIGKREENNYDEMEEENIIDCRIISACGRSFGGGAYGLRI